MKHILILAFAILFTLNAYCQNNATNINFYNIEKQFDADNTIVLKMSFGKYDINSIIGDTSLLHKANQIIVDIVYTDFPATSNFTKLNDKRLQQLHSIFPFIKNNIQINYLRQTNGNTLETAKEMFHGIVIKFRQKQDAEVMKHNIEKLSKMLEETPTEKLVDTLKDSSSSTLEEVVKQFDSAVIGEFEGKGLKTKSRIYRDRVGEEDEIDTTVTQMMYIGLAGDTLMNWRENLSFKDADSTAIMTRKKAIEMHYITKEDLSFKNYEKLLVFYKRDTINPFLYTAESMIFEDDTSSLKNHNKLSDSTLFKIFARNNFKNFNVVGDVTGSMYSYTGQLLLWLKLNSLDKVTSNYTFFNDGDNKRDDEKVVGKTGGVYSKKCNDFKQVKELVLTTMKNGGGGDCPENNIEALLQTEKEFADADYQILIADNWAPIKDKELMKKLRKPVRIVLCGTSYGAVNIDYLNLALQTKGSVHLMEQDLYNLANLHEGEEIKIEDRIYKIIDGKFVDVKSVKYSKI